MGVEYRHYLITRPNGFVPTAVQLAQLIDTLAAERWIAPPGSDELEMMAALNGNRHGDALKYWAWLVGHDEPIPFPVNVEWLRPQLDHDFRFGFGIEHADGAGLRYPFEVVTPDEAYYSLELHLAHDSLLDVVSEGIHHEELVCAQCHTGLQYYLDNDIFYAGRVRCTCSDCGTPFRADLQPVHVANGWTGAFETIPGGAIYRFAVVVDCGKCIPDRSGTPIKLKQELIAICQRVFECEFYEVGNFY